MNAAIVAKEWFVDLGQEILVHQLTSHDVVDTDEITGTAVINLLIWAHRNPMTVELFLMEAGLDDLPAEQVSYAGDLLKKVRERHAEH